MKGTHHDDSKKKLTDREKELLTMLLEPLEEGISFTGTAEDINDVMCEVHGRHGEKWNYKYSTTILSSLVGLDLLEERTDFAEWDTKTREMKVNYQLPVYVIEKDSVIYRRAKYASQRRNEIGDTLWDLIHKSDEYGENLWPFRPVNRVQFEGKVIESDKTGRPILKFATPKKLAELLNQSVRITIDLL